MADKADQVWLHHLRRSRHPSTATGLVPNRSAARRSASAGLVASSKPAASSLSARRSWARATNPVDTGDDSNAAINIAVRSAGTFPAEAGRIAAALTFGPYATVPACPNGTTEVVIFLQQEHFRRGSRGRTFPNRCRRVPDLRPGHARIGAID
jgi:hypothetical protein